MMGVDFANITQKAETCSAFAFSLFNLLWEMHYQTIFRSFSVPEYDFCFNPLWRKNFNYFLDLWSNQGYSQFLLAGSFRIPGCKAICGSHTEIGCNLLTERLLIYPL